MRVCPECGEPAGDQPFCSSCGRNLAYEHRLPSREEWESGQTHPPRPLRWLLLFAAAPLLLAAVGTALVVAISSSRGGGHPHGLRTSGGGSPLSVRVSSASMAPTLEPGAVVRVVANPTYAPKVGDIVYFHPPAGAGPIQPVCGDPAQGTGHPQACAEPTAARSSQTLIRRIVGGPGDRISIENGHVYRDGVRERDNYIDPCGTGPSCNFHTPITIPPGDYFVLGDNRGSSQDSRFWGPVPRSYIIGLVQP